MTLRLRLMTLAVLGLGLTMALWGWVQLRALEKILEDQVSRKLLGIADTVGTYYQHFPTLQGLSALDLALRDLLLADAGLARIDIFAVSRTGVDYLAGAGRLVYEWPERHIEAMLRPTKPGSLKLETEAGPAIGLLHPIPSETGKGLQAWVGVMAYTDSDAEILNRNRSFLLLTSAGLLLFILFALTLSYRWTIGRPLRVIIRTIDEFRRGHYVNRIPLTRRDEWGQLAEHFNSMAAEIERVMARNRELNLELEARVQEATLKAVQLQNQVNQLQQLTAMGYLTATLAHDLGTPIHSIAGMAQLLLERGGWPQDVTRKLELIVQQTQRLDLAIQNVRRATRLPEAHFENVPVQELLNETLPLAEPLIQKSGIRLSVSVDPETPSLYVDRYRTQTALFNLIQNALEAMPAGGAMTVSASREPARNGVAIAVQDTGSGIPQEVMPRIYEPFFSTHTEEGLRGLGLAIVQDIMKMHGGEVEIQSRPGTGTRVILHFPVMETQTQPSLTSS